MRNYEPIIACEEKPQAQQIIKDLKTKATKAGIKTYQIIFEIKPIELIKKGE